MKKDVSVNDIVKFHTDDAEFSHLNGKFAKVLEVHREFEEGHAPFVLKFQEDGFILEAWEDELIAKAI